LIIEKKGTHTFTAFYESNPIISTLYRVKVNPLSPLFSKTVISHMNEESKLYDEYDTKFVHDIRSYPTFKLSLFDKFDNSVVVYPQTFPMRLYFENPAVTA